MTTSAGLYQPGALVKARGRNWVAIPSDEDGVVRLRPVDGIDAHVDSIAIGAGARLQFENHGEPLPNRYHYYVIPL